MSVAYQKCHIVTELTNISLISGAEVKESTQPLSPCFIILFIFLSSPEMEWRQLTFTVPGMYLQACL